MIIYFLAVAGIILTPVAITFLLLHYIMDKYVEERTITIDLSEAIRQARKEKEDE